MDINKLIRYFDLASDVRPTQPQPYADGPDKKNYHVMKQYVALLMGIILQRYFQQYMSKGNWDLTGLWGWVVASCVIAVIVFPGVYKNAFDADKPTFVQLCAIFTSGMGWQSLLGTALKATT